MTTVKKMFKTALSYILILVLVLTLASALPGDVSAEPGELPDDRVADEYGHINGYIPVRHNVNKVEEKRKSALKSSDLESQYRSDEQPWSEGVPVKDQGETGLCWAVSITTAAEYSYAKEEYERTGSVTVPAYHELSGAHLGYFFYNRVNDPLGNTAGDKTIYEGSGLWYKVGGDHVYAMQHMATWSGLALEETAPFSRYDQQPPYSDEIAYTDELTLENCIIKELTAEPDSVNAVKGMVKQYGAVSTSLNMDDQYCMNYNNSAFYNFKTRPVANHAVTIIGWDDDFDKTNFTHTRDSDGYRMRYRGRDLSDEEAAALTTPEKNGAWIVQNSWGTNWGDDGFFYVSYESNDFAAPEYDCDAHAFDMQAADTYDYNFQYDGTSDNGDASDPGNEDFYTDTGTSAANVYTNTTGGPVTLEAVGFNTFNEGTSPFTVDIYKGLENDSDPTGGTHAGTTRASTDTQGVKTVRLKEPVKIEAGEKFSIVFTFDIENFFGVEKDRTGGTFEYDVQLAPGQSYFRVDSSGEWKDMYGYDACFRIKGFASKYTEPVPSAPDPGGKDTPTVKKSANPLKVKGKTVKIRRTKLRKKARKIKRAKIIKVKGAEGRVTYKLVGVKKAKKATHKKNKKYEKNKKNKKYSKYRKYFKVNAKTGRLTVKKRLKKGTYRLRIRVKAAGNGQYEPATKTVTCKVRVK